VKIDFSHSLRFGVTYVTVVLFDSAWRRKWGARTFFNSKSELALNLSSDHNHLTFMGHVAAIDAIEVDGDNATIYAISSTVSGADPNKLVAVTDSLDAGGPSPPSG
jgi:hypothetical protein